MADEFLESLGLNGMAEGGEAPPENHAPDSETAPEAAPVPAPEPETKPEPPKDGGAQPDPDKARIPGKTEAERLRELEAEKIRLEQENARLAKRQRDTQSAYTKASQRLKRLEKGGKPGDPATPEEEPGDWFGEDSPEEEAGPEAGEQLPEESDPPEDPEPANREADQELKRKVDQLSAQQEELRKAEALRKWNAEEAPFRSEHPDYDTVVGKELDEAINAGDELSGYLMSKFKKLGATPGAAYEVGKELLRLRGKETPAQAPEPKTKTPASRQDDPAWNSMPPDKGGEGSGSGSLIDELLAGK